MTVRELMNVVVGEVVIECTVGRVDSTLFKGLYEGHYRDIPVALLSAEVRWVSGKEGKLLINVG